MIRNSSKESPSKFVYMAIPLEHVSCQSEMLAMIESNDKEETSLMSDAVRQLDKNPKIRAKERKSLAILEPKFLCLEMKLVTPRGKVIFLSLLFLSVDSVGFKHKLQPRK